MKLINWLYKHKNVFSLIIFIVFLTLYGSTVPQFNVGYADSDEFLAVSYNWGNAHPPGYPIYTTLLYLVMHLPIPHTTPAFRAHFISAIALASTLALSIQLFQLIFEKLIPKKQQNKSLFVITSTITVLTIGTSKLVWLYGQITEKYLFAAPFLILLIIYATKIILNKKITLKQVAIFSFLFGLLIAHHQSFVFLTPFWLGTLILAFKDPHKTVFMYLTSLGSFALALIISIGILWLQVNQNPPAKIAWNSGTGVTGLINLITRSDFRGEIYASNTDSNGYTPTQIDIAQVTNGLVTNVTQLGQSFNWWILLPLLLSFFYLKKQTKEKVWLLYVPPIIMGLLLTIYLGWPKDIGSQAITQRFYIAGYISLIPTIFFSLYYFQLRFYKALSITKASKTFIGISASLIPLFLVIQTIILYPQISLKNFDAISNIYHQSLTQAKPNSLFTCYSDTSCFALLYEQSVNKYRQDVEVVPLSYPLVVNSTDIDSLQTFSYPGNPFKMFDIVTTNIDKRPVYAIDLSQYFFSLFGIGSAITYAIPHGYALELTRTIPEEIPTYSYQETVNISNASFPQFDLYRLFLGELIAQNHFTNSFTLLNNGQRIRAQQELNAAMNLSNQLRPDQNERLSGKRTEIESIQPDSQYASNATVVSPELLMQDISTLYEQNRGYIVYKLCIAAITIDPTYLPARLELARIYELSGDIKFSQIEYGNVLQLDPNNQEAQQKLINAL